MNIIYYLKLYTLTFSVFFIIDIIWLGFVARGFFKNNLGFILAPSLNWAAAIILYLIIAAGILIFAVLPALSRDSLVRAALLGALLGFVTYAAYDLTNLATIEKWPMVVVVVDILWGMFLCSLTAVSGFLIARWLS